jgi:hypothetical protein
VPLVEVDKTLDIVEELVDAAFQDAFNVFLQFFPGDLNEDPDRVAHARGERIEVGSQDTDLSVHHVTGRPHPHDLPLGIRLRATKFELHVIASDPLALKHEADLNRECIGSHLSPSNDPGRFIYHFEPLMVREVGKGPGGLGVIVTVQCDRDKCRCTVFEA